MIWCQNLPHMPMKGWREEKITNMMFQSSRGESSRSSVLRARWAERAEAARKKPKSNGAEWSRVEPSRGRCGAMRGGGRRAGEGRGEGGRQPAHALIGKTLRAKMNGWILHKSFHGETKRGQASLTSGMEREARQRFRSEPPRLTNHSTAGSLPLVACCYGLGRDKRALLIIEY